MTRPPRPAPFVLLATDHGTMIVNRNDYYSPDGVNAYGVGCQLLTRSSFDSEEVQTVLALLENRHRNFGDGVVALDCGANIGVHTVEWARAMHGWGKVIAFEAQEKLFYALAGNVALNNCLNAVVRHAAVGDSCGTLRIPVPDYCVPSSYGSLELVKRAENAPIGQAVDYDHPAGEVALLTIDSLNLPRVDFIKIDVEGMEMEVLHGAQATIRRCRPQIIAEVIKSGHEPMTALLKAEGYQVFPLGINLLALHATDPQCALLLSQGGKSI